MQWLAAVVESRCVLFIAKNEKASETTVRRRGNASLLKEDKVPQQARRIISPACLSTQACLLELTKKEPCPTERPMTMRPKYCDLIMPLSAVADACTDKYRWSMGQSNLRFAPHVDRQVRTSNIFSEERKKKIVWMKIRR